MARTRRSAHLEELRALKSLLIQANLRLVVSIAKRSPEALLLEQDALRTVKRALESLSDRERLVLELRYGLTNAREHTLQEIAERLGVTREWVRQIEKRALERLRRRRNYLGRREPAA